MLFSRKDGLDAASAQLDQKLFAAGLKHAPTVRELAASMVIDNKAKAEADAINSTGQALAGAAVNRSYFGGAGK